MPVNDAVVVTMDTGAPEAIAHQLPSGVEFFLVALQIGQPCVARIETVRGMPVILDGRRDVLVRNRRSGIDHERQTHDGDPDDQSGEQSSTLEANFASLALLCETSDSFG